MSSNCLKRAGAVGTVVFLAALATGISSAGAAIAGPAASVALTVTTAMDNAGHGTFGPDSFVYHVTRTSDSTEVASGIWNHSGKTKINLAPGTYSITEDPLAPYSERTAQCTNITLTAGHPKACTLTNQWTFAQIHVTTSIANAGGGTADASAFHYVVTDTSDNSVVKRGVFDKSGNTTIFVPGGTFAVTEDPAEGYVEDVSSCASLTVDYLTSAPCIIANTFDPHATTTMSNTSSTRPGDTQVTVHGSTSGVNSCVLTLQPALQDPSTVNITTSLASDAFAQPHKGDPITLSNTTVKLITPASLLQSGVDLGIVNNGDKIPESVTLVLKGDGTKEATHTYAFTVPLTIAVVAGKAQPLTATATLPNTVWTPNNNVDPVFFSERSVKITSTITSAVLGGSVASVFTCDTPFAPSFIALAAQGGAIPTTTQGSGPGGSGGPGSPGGGGSTGATGTGSGILPVTGTSVWLWIVPAILLIDVGLLAIGATARSRRRSLNRSA